jgi:hypothetical protein
LTLPRTITRDEIRMDWKRHDVTWHLVIPKGTRCRPITEGGTAGRYWVDDLAWIDEKANGMLKHDATYYGIDIPAEMVETLP